MRSAEHKAGGQESVQQRLQSGPMDGTEKCEEVYKLWTINSIFISITTFPTA